MGDQNCEGQYVGEEREGECAQESWEKDGGVLVRDGGGGKWYGRPSNYWKLLHSRRQTNR